MPRRSNDEQDKAAEAVLVYERDAARPRIFDANSVLFRGTAVALAIGATWGIAIAFQNFTTRLEQLENAGKQRERLITQQRKSSLQIREFRDWLKEFKIRNQGKADVPEPYIERDEDGYPR